MYLHLRAYTYRKGVFGNLAVPSAALVEVLTQVETLFGKARMLPSDRLSAEMAMLLFDCVPIMTLAVCPTHADDDAFGV